MGETTGRIGTSPTTARPGVAAAPLFEVARDRRSGVLTATCERRTRLFFVQKGFLEMIWAPESRQFFEKLLGATDLVKPRKLQKALKTFPEGATLFFPQYLYECGYLEKEPCLEFFRGYARQELFRIVTETGWNVVFQPGRIDLAPLAQKVEDWRFHLELEPVVIEAARQVGAEGIFDVVFPSERDVCLPATPADAESILAANAPTGSVAPAPESNGRRQVRTFIDGVRDLGEVLAAATTGRFETLLAIYQLEREGTIRRANAADLLGLADGFQKNGRIDKCQKLLLRAQELGADGPDLPLRIAKNYELTGAVALAVEQYVGHAERCISANRNDDAAQCLRRVVALRPDEVRARLRLIEILQSLGLIEEMSAEHRALAEVYASLGETAKAAASLERVVEVGHFGDEVLSDLANLWSSLPAEGDKRGIAAVLARFRDVADRFLSMARRGDAIRVLEFALTEQGFDADATVTLATSLEAEGRLEEAAENFDAVSRKVLRGETTLAGGEAATAALLESVLRLRPGDTVARRALADRYRALGESGRALAHLRTLERLFAESGDAAAHSRTLEALVELEPAAEQHRVALAESYFREERTHLGLRTLLDVASRRAKSGDEAGAREAAERVLKVEALHVGAHRLLLELDRANGRRLETTVRLRLLADLCRLRGDFEDAERLSLELWRDHPEDPRLLLGLADIYEARGDAKKLEGTLAELLRQSLKAENVGFGRQAAAKLQAVNPQNPILRDAAVKLERAARPSDEEEIARRVREIEASVERRVRDRVAEELSRQAAASPAPTPMARPAAAPQPAERVVSRPPSPIAAIVEAVPAPVVLPKPILPCAIPVEEQEQPVGVVELTESMHEESLSSPAGDAPQWSTVKEEPQSISGIVEKLRSMRVD
ncbi:MAG: tetratricopeptide repeat protein [Planctomycetes bacterium]|nr:tetratricopeptide repeat protein [Planctomycetota bacterium]